MIAETYYLHLVQAIGVVGAIGTLIVLYNAVRSWRDRPKGIWGKIQATILALVTLGYMWFALAGNLLHFSSNY